MATNLPEVRRPKRWLAFLLLLFPLLLIGQEPGKPAKDPIRLHKDYPLIVTASFQNFCLPFRDFGSHFSHPGLWVGSELGLNKRKTLLQQAHVGGYLNSDMGGGLLLATQTVYRPRIYKNLSAEVKLGLGFCRSGHPGQAWGLQEGEWVETAGWKTQVMLPIGISAEYHRDLGGAAWVPFVGYQVVPMLGYNSVLPLTFQNHFQVGIRHYFIPSAQ